MIKRQFAVLGLGKFGASVAETLAGAGYEVIAVDVDEDKIQEIADQVTYALRADVTEPGVLKNIGVSNVDAVIVAMSDNMEASVMATILAKEAGAPYVLSKANNEMHGTILRRIGADEVILPEKAMGTRTAKKLISRNFLDLYELSRAFSMVEIKMPELWVGKTLREMDLPKKGINVIGIIDGDKVRLGLDPDQALPADATVIIVAKNDILSKIV